MGRRREGVPRVSEYARGATKGVEHYISAHIYYPCLRAVHHESTTNTSSSCGP